MNTNSYNRKAPRVIAKTAPRLSRIAASLVASGIIAVSISLILRSLT